LGYLRRAASAASIRLPALTSAGRCWLVPDIVAVARGAPGAPRPVEAVRAWSRAQEKLDSDERNVMFALLVGR
jgi:hypothetical protein